MRLTPEQFAVVESEGDVYVRACPGAGKTRTLVELAKRFTTRAPRRGVAFLSFTNAAGAEVRQRLTSDAPHLLRAPSYVGTFDSFLIRYVLGPDGLSTAPNARVQFCETWNDTVGLKSVSAGFPLDLFVPDGVGGLKLDDARADHVERAVLKKLTDDQRRQLIWVAERKLKPFLSRGVVTSPFLRAEAATRLSVAPAGLRVAHRFQLVLVDEAQDCDSVDLQIVSALRGAGCRLVVVADPEQGIFRFRGADPLAIGTLGLAELALTGNFRSTASICAASASLRAHELPPDTPQGEPRPEHPVQLLVYETSVGAEVGAQFSELLKRHKVDRANAIVVAHRDEDARRAVGAERAHDSTARGAVLARAVSPAASADDRAAGVQRIEEVLLSSLGEVAPGEPAARWCRVTARQILGTVAAGDATRGVCARARDALSSLSPPESTAFVENPRKLFNAKEPKGDLSRARMSVELRFSTAHGVKGREFDAVLVVVPNSTRLGELLSAWRDREHGHDGRAVLYVAATRARTLLAFAVPRHAASDVAGLLTRRGARVEQIVCSAVSTREDTRR
ncbi:UvrD-helicase domain-containing protein [Sandaracinus amylolyticus]|uniref:UvrD-helicase domain-containing protein n=1 Tax=Sandaracinus amylolyticus TaxID=927083 RepID=UPI001F279E7E|nr:UvrD-helicase domain-containing protein [Sandaracinus amylolyticus]UJR83827.1 Hypothetical protein I5071_58980 [Sandaracinus amylolyticus]